MSLKSSFVLPWSSSFNTQAKFVHGHNYTVKPHASLLNRSRIPLPEFFTSEILACDKHVIHICPLKYVDALVCYLT